MLAKIKIKYLLKGLFLAFIITIVSLVASMYSAVKIKENGWINGAIVGITYYLILLIINIFFIKSFDSSFIIISKVLISMVTGIIGGMIGINLS